MNDANAVEPRMLTGEDWRLWRSIRLAALADAPEAFGSTLARERDFHEAEWRDRAAPASGVTFGCVSDDGRPLGAAGVFIADPEQGTPELFGMWVAPEARGTGIAGALVDRVLDWATEQGYRSILLWVVVGNRPAVRLYERHGFVPLPRFEPHQHLPGVREQLMRRPLTDRSVARDTDQPASTGR